MFAPSLSFSATGFRASPKAQERRVALAFLFSTALHAAIGVLVAVWITSSPDPAPQPPSQGVLLQAKLQEPEPTPVTLELTPIPPLVLEPVTMLAPAPSVPLAPVAATAPAPVKPVSRPNITSPDPNGSVTMGLLEDPSLVGRGVAAKLAARYSARPDREPRLIGSLIVPYPPEARQAHASARIAAVLDIDARGNITHVVLVPDHHWFGPAVTEVLKEARFTPAEFATNPVPYWAIVEFVFAIPPAPSS
ncbi:MAG: energy transducer TonB [Pseudomonadota bacterium]|nr:energy transducer TonB [Pseudomonadota bacterium]